MTDDLIGRAEAQTAIQFAARRYTVAHEAHGEGQVVWSDNLINVTDAMNVLRDLPSAQPEPHWIPCSERLPEEETDVLVTRTFLGCKDGSHGWNNHIPPTTYVEVAQYFNGEWTALSDEYKIARNRHTNPIAWMPLPEPYQERGEQ